MLTSSNRSKRVPRIRWRQGGSSLAPVACLGTRRAHSCRWSTVSGLALGTGHGDLAYAQRLLHLAGAGASRASQLVEDVIPCRSVADIPSS